MSNVLKATGRPIVFSICEWGSNEPWKWAEGIGHLWRTTPDIRNIYSGKLNWGGLGITNIIDLQADLWKHAGPGHWNDPDMLEVGNTGLTLDENITHFSMWAMLAAPLITGNDIRAMDDEILSILKNEEVIAINQDSLGNQAIRFLDMGDHEIWVKHLQNKELAICFLNRSEETWQLDYDWTRLNIYHKGSIRFSKQNYSIRDLWKHENIGTTRENLKIGINKHGVLLLKLHPIK